MKKYFILCVLVILCCVVACKKSHTLMYDFSGNTWDFQQPINFNLNIDDTTSNYSIFIFFRNTIEYPYQNIYFLIQTQHEDAIQYNMLSPTNMANGLDLELEKQGIIILFLKNSKCFKKMESIQSVYSMG